MNFANAAVLITAVFGFVELAKKMLPAGWMAKSWAVVLLVVAVSFGAVFLIAETFWANQQVIGDLHLDKASVADKVLISLFLAGAAAGVERFLNKGIAQIGENNPPTNLMQP